MQEWISDGITLSKADILWHNFNDKHHHAHLWNRYVRFCKFCGVRINICYAMLYQVSIYKHSYMG